MRHEPGGHVVNWPGWSMVAGGACDSARWPKATSPWAGSLLEVTGLRRTQQSDADRQGEPLPCRDPVNPQIQVLGRRLFRVGAGAAGVAFRARVV